MRKHIRYIGLIAAMSFLALRSFCADCFEPTDGRYATFCSERSLGVSSYEQGRYMDAIPHFEKAYELCPLDSVLNEYLYFSYVNTLRPLDANRLFSGLPATSVSQYGLKRSKTVSSLYAEGGVLFADSKTAWDDSYIYFERYLVGNGGFASVDMKNEMGGLCEMDHHFGVTTRTNPVEMKGSNSTYFNLKSKYVGFEYEVSAKFNVSSRWKVMPFARVSREAYDEVRFALDTTAASAMSANSWAAPYNPWGDGGYNPWLPDQGASDGKSGNDKVGDSPENRGDIPETPEIKADENPNDGNYWENYGNDWWNRNDRNNDNQSDMDPKWGDDIDENIRKDGYSDNKYNYNVTYPYYLGWYNPWWSYLYNPYGQSYYQNYDFPEYDPTFWQQLSQSSYRYTHTSSRHKRMDFLVGCLASYSYGRHVGTARVSYFNGERLRSLQSTLSYCFYPLGNLNFYISPNVSYIWRGNDYVSIGELPGNWLGELEVGGKLRDRLWGNVAYMQGNLCDFHDQGSHTFYSLSCETKFRCSAQLIYLVNRHVEVMLTYKFIRKQSDLFLVDVNGNPALDSFNQNDNVIAGGVQWNF